MTINYKIQIGRSFDPIISELHSKAENMSLREIAANSNPTKLFDIKSKYKNVGALLNHKYATSRSAGNYLAGYNARFGTQAGYHISHKTFQQLAGALHIKTSQGKKLTNYDKFIIVMYGSYINEGAGSFRPPTWGENYYQYRMSLDGWNHNTN